MSRIAKMGGFAMRLIGFLVFALFLGVFPALAQEDTSVYKITDVIVDVTAERATLARDMAMAQAQRQAYGLLLERLGAQTPQGQTPDETIAQMVQALELQKEYASGSRYTGTFSVQFKPDAIRQYLAGKGASFVETKAEPLLVLPLVHSKERDVLWEEPTHWHEAWAEQSKKPGLIPLMVAQGDLDDISKISTKEALKGEVSALQAIMQKYNASGALVAVLQKEAETPDVKVGPVIDVYRYNNKGEQGTPFHLSLPPILAEKDTLAAYVSAAGTVVADIEKGWRTSNQAPSGPAAFLPVAVEVPTLAAWTQMRGKMKAVPAIVDAHVVTMTRGLIHAEVEFRGDLPSLQKSLTQQSLSLEQGAQGGWFLRELGGAQE